MKNNKLPFTILFGLLFAAIGGNVFANVALEEAKGWMNPNATADDIRIGLIADKDAAAKLTLSAKPAAAPVVAVPPVPAPVPAPEPKPNPIKKFISENKTNIFSAGLGAYLGFAVAGTLAGALTGGIFVLAILALSEI